MRIAVVNTHPVQYYTPIFRELARKAEVTVFFAHRPSLEDQANAGFGVGFEWDIDLTAGFHHVFLKNVASVPNVHSFGGCDTPDIADHLHRGAFDAVLLMGWQSKRLVQALVASKRRRIPVMVRGDSHLETPRSKLKKAVKTIAYPMFLRSFDAALYVGQRSRSYWLHYGFPKARLFRSPHCVDTEWFGARATKTAGIDLRRSIGLSETAKVVLFAGKLLPRKRPSDLIEALARSMQTEENLHLMIAGSGPLEREVIEQAEARRLPLHILGFCNQSRMPSVYASADVLVLPSSIDTWGLVANEALASGCPIIVSDACGCAPDLAADGRAGRSIPVGDVAALSDAISDVLARPPGKATIAARSSEYSVEVAVEGILAAAEYLANGHPMVIAQD